MRLVDLSQDIYQGMMVYPGHLKTVLFDHVSHEETAPRFTSGFSFQTKGFLLNDNGPTHVDSFSHLDPDPSALTIDQMPLDLFYGDAVCIDVTGAEPRTDIPVSRVGHIGLQHGPTQRQQMLPQPTLDLVDPPAVLRRLPHQLNHRLKFPLRLEQFGFLRHHHDWASCGKYTVRSRKPCSTTGGPTFHSSAST